jgi:hypothetical protein
MWLARIRLLLVTFWAGSLWAVGLVVAPILFSTLSDRALAGTIAGSLFRTEAMLAGVLGLVVVVLIQLDRGMPVKLRRNLCLAILGVILFGAAVQLGIAPMMTALRAEAAGSVMDGAMRNKFILLHGAASICYLMQCLFAGYVVLRNPRATH